MAEVTYDDIVQSHVLIAPHIHRTPVHTSHLLNQRARAEVFLKCDNFQRTGSFKIRGVMNFLSRLDPAERARGVVAPSSGNHAQALAYGAQVFGVPCWIVMPHNAPKVKQDATRAYGAEVVLCEPNLKSRDAGAQAIIDREGAVLVHPYDHPWTIMGQGTAALELMQDVPGLDTMIAPVSGGGLLSGTAIAACGAAHPATPIGAEPEIAGDAAASFAKGALVMQDAGPTIADGLRANLSPLTFGILKERVPHIVTLSEEEIKETTYFLWERTKVLCEPSCATAAAALLFRRDQVPGQRIGVIISGGNVDLRGVLG